MALLDRGPEDAELARRIAAGDESAFIVLDERHRRPLARYARSLLRSDHDAEDVVQDVLIRAHAALRAGDGPDELRPWLYKVTRNRAIDHVRRARWGDEALDDEAASALDHESDPEAVMRRREAVRRLVEDLADLPMSQRTALLARELDGDAPEDVAQRLGVSVAAAQMLAARARENLVKTRDARDANCPDVRRELALAHERGVRPSAHALRHVKGCAPCTAYRRDLKRLSTSLRGLSPPIGLPFVGAVAKALGVGGGKTAAGAAAVVIAATGGVAVLASDVFSSGDPAPFELKGVKAYVGKGVGSGDRLPRDTALVTARVRIAAGAPDPGERRSVTLSCPAGMRVAGMQAPEQHFPLSYGLSKGTIMGASTRARIDFERAVLPRDFEATVGVLCRRPGPTGSLATDPRATRTGETPARVCAPDSYLYRSPGRLFVGTVFKDQPVSVQRRSRSGEWSYVVSDIGSKGWVRTTALCK